MSDINFRNLTHDANAGIYVCDPEANFIYANQELADIFDVEHPRDIIGKNFKDFISPGSANAFMEQFQKLMASESESILLTTEIARQDGKRAYVEVKAKPFIKNQNLDGNQGVVYDITKFRQSESDWMYRVNHDSLTGIYNRTFFEDEINRLQRGRQFPISMISISVEGLENLQESKDGEGEGKSIVQIARQIIRSFRGDDIVARIGENEFGILLPNVDQDTVQVIVRRLEGELLKLKRGDSKLTLKFYIGAGTAKNGESLYSALKKAESMVTHIV